MAPVASSTRAPSSSERARFAIVRRIPQRYALTNSQTRFALQASAGFAFADASRLTPALQLSSLTFIPLTGKLSVFPLFVCVRQMRAARQRARATIEQTSEDGWQPGLLHSRFHFGEREHRRGQDRKSTRLNSSHLVISYAVFCLKKKHR